MSCFFALDRTRTTIADIYGDRDSESGVTDSADDDPFDLFGAKIDITLPETPVTVNAYGYNGSVESTSRVNEVKYDKNDCKLIFTVEMLKNNSSFDRTYARMVYKINNENGVTVDTGTLSVGPMSAGDKMEETVYLYMIDKSGKYTLVLEDYRY